MSREPDPLSMLPPFYRAEIRSARAGSLYWITKYCAHHGATLYVPNEESAKRAKLIDKRVDVVVMANTYGEKPLRSKGQ